MINRSLLKNVLLTFFILLKFYLQSILINPVYELHRDEFLHLDQGKHLAWGYISVPPFTSWISWLIAALGSDIFWVKFFPTLFGVITLIIVWKAIESLKGNIFALVLGATCITFSSLLRFNMLYQPNSFDIMSWTLLYFCLTRYFLSPANKWLWFAALTFAIGFLNKYNIIFCVAGLLPALIISRQREIFTRPVLYYAAALALLIILPNLIWQVQHGLPVISHMKELADTQLVNVKRSDFLKDQLLFFFGAIPVIIAAFVALFIYRPFKRFRFLFWAVIITLALFTYLKAKNYYAVGLYPIFIAFGAVYWEKLLQPGWRYWLRPLLIVLPVLLFIPFFNLVFPVKTPQVLSVNPGKMKELGMLRWEDGKDHALPQDFADMQGWKELAAITDSAYARIKDKSGILVRADNYGQAGAINFYSSFKNIHALSYNADYINWFPKDKKWENLVLIKTGRAPDSTWARERSLFDTGYIAGKINNPYAREKGTTVYVLLGAHPEVQQIIHNEIEERK